MAKSNKPELIEISADTNKVEPTKGVENKDANVDEQPTIIKDRLWVSLIIAGVIALLIMFVTGKIYQCETAKDVMDVLTNALTTSGVVLICLSGLTFVSNNGGFSMLSFGVNNALHMIMPRGKYKHKNYYDYVQELKSKPKRSVKCKLIVGGSCILLGIIFLSLYYTM